jgi:hypothetical protein
MTLVHIVASLTLDHIVVFGIALVALLMSSPVMLCSEHLWNFCVVQEYTFPILFSAKAEDL